MTPLAAIADLLRQRIGLDPTALGSAALAHAVRGRARTRGVTGADAYLAVLQDDADEWDALLESVVVPETWFFRDREPFALLSRWARAAGAARPADDPVRVLSLPCATGEEAWSIAIALAAAGIAPAAFRVDAFDLSERALSTARQARYAARALRGRHLDPAWAAYLVARDGGIEVSPALHGSVSFARANLVDAPAVLAGRRYDCIFSRNLLIYCDAAARAAALACFTAALRPEGLLFLGHAETLPAGTAGFVREGSLAAFAWRRVEATPRSMPKRAAHARAAAPRSLPFLRGKDRMGAGSREHAPIQPSSKPPILSFPRKGGRDPLSAAGKPATRVPRSREQRAANPLARARALADRGALAEAAALAEVRLAAAADDAAAHALLGVIRAAEGRAEEAIEHLRRAVYLEPTHAEALAHLALLLEQRGERRAAARLRARARRAEEPR